MSDSVRRWWDVIPRLSRWILSAVTFLAAVVGFVKLFDTDFELVLSVVLVVGVVGAWLGLAYLAFGRAEAGAGTERSRARTRRIAGGAGLVLIPLVAVSGFFFYRYLAHSARFDPVIRQNTKLIERNPNDVDAHLARGARYLQRKDADQALADFNEAVKYGSSNPEAYRLRAEAYAFEKQWDQAISDYTRAIEHGGDSSLYVSRGIARYNNDDIPSAIVDFDHAILLDDKDSWAYKLRGVAYRESGKLDQAIGDFSKAIDIDPDPDTSMYVNRGIAYFESGKLEQALADYQRAIRREPEDPWAYKQRAIAIASTGGYDEATRNLEMFLERNADPEDEADVRKLLDEYRSKSGG